MFDGNKACTLCKKELADSEKNFGKSLLGYSYAFCDRCFKERKEDIRRLLHEEKS